MHLTVARTNPLRVSRLWTGQTGTILQAGILALLILFSTLPGAALGQDDSASAEAAQVPEALNSESMQSLVSKLDAGQTAALVELIELLGSAADAAALAGQPAGPDAMEIVQQWFRDFGDNMQRHILALPKTLTSVGQTIARIFQQRDNTTPLGFLFLFAAVIVIGVAAEWLFKRVTRARRDRIRESRPEGLIETLKVLSVRAGIEIGGVIVFTVAALVAAKFLISGDTNHELVTRFVLTAILITRMTLSLMHFVLAPRRPELRLVSTDSWNAQFIERHFVLIAGFVGIGFFLSSTMQQFDQAHTDSLRFWIGLSLHLWLIAVIMRAHGGLTQIIEGGEENLTPGLKRMANWWPGVSAGFVAFNWLFLQFVLSAGHQGLSPERSGTAIALIVLAPFLDTIVRGIAAHLVPVGDGSNDVVDNAYDETRLSYIRIGRVILISLIIILVGKLWGVSLQNLTEAGFGAQVAANAVGFLLIVALGYLAWEVTNLAINRHLAKESPSAESGAEGGTGETRMATVLPILQLTLQVTIIILTLLLGLSQLGFNITPLLAGAGVLGLAIGFGAQTLVKDIVSGVFFLLDDAFRVGEFITVGSTGGLVAKISVRSLQLRQDTGQLHIIPYGSMSQLTNNSRDWVTMKIRFTVPFDTDQEKVRKLFKKIGQEMMEAPALAEVLINPFKSQGAAEVTDVGIVIRGKFTTVPGGQFLIRKEVFSRVQKAFEENGIEFARKEVRVHLPESVRANDLSEEQKKAVSAAAEQAAETP